MLNKRNMAELHKRITITENSIYGVRGCYVSMENGIQMQFHSKLMTMEEKEIFKYLEIAKKCISKKANDNILDLEFREHGGMHPILDDIRRNRMQDDEAAEALFEAIMNEYTCTGDFMIMLFGDVYDVPGAAKDGSTLEDGEDVYDYLICAICKIGYSPSGLAYDPEKMQIAAAVQEKMVAEPEFAFIYPAFIDRKAEESHCMFYSRKAKDIDHGIITKLLDCVDNTSASEQREKLEDLVREACNSLQLTSQYMMKINNEIMEIMMGDLEPMIDAASIEGICENAEIPDPYVEKIVELYKDEMPVCIPAENLFDKPMSKK